MKILHIMKISTLLTAMALMLTSIANAADTKTDTKSNLSVGLVNFKTCVEQSKIGKQEQTTFESMKKQMESILEEKEKTLNEIVTKSNDPDYLDSLAPEAETELKRKFRALGQELTQQQNQYYQTLQQANYKIVQRLADAIAKASAEVAKDKKLDLVLNDESGFYHDPSLDISTLVVAKMDEAYDKEVKDKANQPPTTQPKN